LRCTAGGHKIKRANKRWSLKPRQLTSTVMAMMM
jgi:hypothetical protein